MQGEQAGIPRACAHQDHLALGSGILGKERVGQLVGRGLIAPCQSLTEAVGAEQPLPELAPLPHAREAGLDPVSQAAGKGRHRAEMLGQQGFEFFPQQSGQHRGLAAGGDGHHQG
ncbi:hypothetical protein D3C80_1740270 [compost metagenome]